MERNTTLLPHHSDTSTRPLPNDAEAESPTIIRPSQRQTKPNQPGDQRMKIHEEISMLKDENTRLTQEREELIKDLEDCKSELFKRIPRTQISDHSVRKALERIRGSIDGFVFDIMGDIVDDALYNFCRFCQEQQHKPKQKRRNVQNPLSSFIANENISAWGPFSCSNFYILSVIIQWILDESVFVNDDPMGVTKEQVKILEEVEKGMWHASQAQKQERFDLWRSETLTALTALPENETRLEQSSRRICHDLNHILSPWLSKSGAFAEVEESLRREVEEKFRQDILGPAIKLHQDLKCSSHQYKMRRITVFDKHSPRQMLDEWDLKDADTWQKPRGEKDVGKALYCLHPSIVRLGARGTSPIVIVKPVVVVTSPKREKDNSQSGMTALAAAIKSSPSVDQVTSSLNRESSAQTKLVDNPSMFTDSDSTTGSRSRRRISQKRRVSTYPTTQKHEYPSRSSQRRQSVPLDPTRGGEDHLAYSESFLEGERQSSGKVKGDGDGQAYLRGHHIQGSSYSHRSPGAARRPRTRASGNTSGRRNSPYKSAHEKSQPPTAPSSPVPSMTSD